MCIITIQHYKDIRNQNAHPLIRAGKVQNCSCIHSLCWTGRGGRTRRTAKCSLMTALLQGYEHFPTKVLKTGTSPFPVTNQ